MERETLEVDVLVIGAGPAGLAFAVKLAQLSKEAGREDAILVLDKAEEIGHHQLSGAVMDPRGVLEIWPHAESEGFPIQAKVKKDSFWWLLAKKRFSLKGPFVPSPFKNVGKWIVSLNEVVKWMATKAEEVGVEVYPGFAASKILYGEDGGVTGVQTVDQGRNKDHVAKANFQPGYEIKAKLTVFAEGTRGSLTKDLIRDKKLDKDSNSQIWAVGVKEIWQVDESMEGEVIHTGGWPLEKSTYGGGWIYGLPNRQLSIGFVVGMDHGNASFDYHAAMQAWKTHPVLAKLLDGGKLLKYGAKTIPEGGLYSLPKLSGPGYFLVGDAAGFMNTQRLKGIHLSMKSGSLAAETALATLLNPSGVAYESTFQALFESSWAYRELHKVRNFRQAFQKGFWYAMVRGGLDMLLGGRLPGRLPTKSDYVLYEKELSQISPRPSQFDEALTFTKLSSVFLSDTSHEEDQPVHLVVGDAEICQTRCTVEFGNPCQDFCPASVYEWQDGALTINASNCVHCKTCDIADPYENINWVTPEGGGPVYSGM